jgi:DNA-binding response OmpR family regulator
VLVIEDETTLAGLIAAYLSRAGYATTTVHTGPDGVQAVREHAPDVVILDLGLPGLDGIEVCRQIRTFSDCYVIVVTARKDEIDTLIGLSVGADDYVTKPFSVRELLARVQTVLRRPRTGSTSASETPSSEPIRVVVRALRVDPNGHRVHLADTEVALTPTERDLLITLGSTTHDGLHPSPAHRRHLGNRTGSGTSTSSMSTSPTCAANSATTPTPADTSRPSEASATGWDKDDHHPQFTLVDRPGDQAPGRAGHRPGRRRADRGPGRSRHRSPIFHQHLSKPATSRTPPSSSTSRWPTATHPSSPSGSVCDLAARSRRRHLVPHPRTPPPPRASHPREPAN